MSHFKEFTCIIKNARFIFIPKVEEVDLYTQHRYQDYRWLVDISLCAFVVYSCVEIAVLWKSEVRAQEFNLSLVWCLMIVCFAMYPFHFLTEKIFSIDTKRLFGIG